MTDSDQQSGDTAHADAVLAQLRLAEENSTLPDDLDDEHTIRPAQDLVCPVCERYRGTDEAAMAQHLRREHDGAGRWGPELLSDGGDTRDLRDILLDVAEASEAGNHDRAINGLHEALSREKQARSEQACTEADD
jgi:hypothetical protein